MVTSGIRLGTPAITTRGFKEAEIEQTTHYIVEIINRLKSGHSFETNGIKEKVLELCAQFPIYPTLRYL